MTMRHLIHLIALTLTAACSSVPPVSLDSEYGRVRAGTPEQAGRVAEVLAFAPQVRDTLRSTRSDLPVVWVVDRDLDAIGVCFERRIELMAAGTIEPTCLIHELVHWYIPGSPFEGMPHFLQEGLCDFVALGFMGLLEARRRENDAIGALTVPSASLGMGTRDWFDLPRETRQDLSRLGFEVVSRLGLDRTEALAAARAEPLGYIQEAQIAISQAERAFDRQVWNGGRTGTITAHDSPEGAGKCAWITFTDVEGNATGTATHRSGSSGSTTGPIPPGSKTWELTVTDCPSPRP